MAKAGNALIGALRVSLSADTAQFEAGLKAAQVALGKFGSAMTKPMIAVSTAITSAVGVMATGIKLALNRADDFGKAAQKFGVPVEQLSALAYAAKLADVSFETLGQGLKKLSVETAKAGGDVGTVEGQFLKLADRIAAMPDGVNKTALAVKYLGKSGAELIPLMNGGAAAIKKATDEAREFGLIVTDEAAAGAERFNDNLTRLSGIMAGVFVQLAAGIAGPLADFTDNLVAIAKDGKLANLAVEAFKTVLDVLPAILIDVNELIAKTALTMSRLGETLGQFQALEFSQMGASAAVFQANLAKITDEAERARQALRWSQLTGMSPRDNPVVKVAEDGGAALDELTTKTKETDAAINDLIEKSRLIPAGYADAVIAGDRYQVQLEETRDIWSDIGNTIQNVVVNAIDDLIEGTLTWKSALSSALRAAAGILGGVGNQAITDQGGWGAIMGFAEGGQFKVGGSGGVDSQLVQFMATPGERVSISKDDNPQGFAFAPVTNIDARGSSISQAELRAVLDARDNAWRNALPGQFKAARIRGKL